MRVRDVLDAIEHASNKPPHLREEVWTDGRRVRRGRNAAARLMKIGPASGEAGIWKEAFNDPVRGPTQRELSSYSRSPSR